MSRISSAWTWGLGGGQKAHRTLRSIEAAVGLVYLVGGLISVLGTASRLSTAAPSDHRALVLEVVGGLLRSLGLGGLLLGMALSGRRLGAPQPLAVSACLPVFMVGVAIGGLDVGSGSAWSRTIQALAAVLAVFMIAGLAVSIRRQRRERTYRAQRAGRG